jgi:hypothetical protein
MRTKFQGGTVLAQRHIHVHIRNGVLVWEGDRIMFGRRGAKPTCSSRATPERWGKRVGAFYTPV